MYFFHPRWPVFFEDNHLLVLYKPAGLIMQRGKETKFNLLDLAKLWIKTRYNKPGNVYLGMVHRLDGPVAGVTILARTSKAAARLSEQFRKGTIKKVYLAITHGKPKSASDRLVHFLVRRGRYSRISDTDLPGAQKSILSYERIDSYKGKSLLKISLETGRRHQIRCQLAAIGCPILGDRHYGSEKFLQDGRIALLARQIEFTHPTQQSHMLIQSPFPESWPWNTCAEKYSQPFWTIEEFKMDGMCP